MSEERREPSSERLPSDGSGKGRAEWRRRALLVVFVGYLGAVAYSTMGPDPSSKLEGVAARAGDAARRVEGMRRTTAPTQERPEPAEDWLTKLDAEDTGNVLMFVPFGVLVPVLWPRRHRWVVPLGVATSALIELTQLTMATHRSPEWSDIWWNGCGVVIGYGVWVVGWLVWRRVAVA